MTKDAFAYRQRDMIQATGKLLIESDPGTPWSVTVDDIGTLYFHGVRGGYVYSVAVAPIPIETESAA